MRTAAAPALLLLAACNQNMVQQPRQDDYEAGALTSGRAPEDTVAQGQPDVARPPMSMALLDRGQERYAIYCSMCHGEDGRGGGIVPARGYPRPPSLLKPATPQHLYEVIGEGSGIMYGFKDRVPPADRWAIAAYVEALRTKGVADAR